MVSQGTPDQPLHSFTSFLCTWSTRRQRSRRRLPRKDDAAEPRHWNNFPPLPPFPAKPEGTHTKLSSPSLSSGGSDAIPNSRVLRLRVKCGDREFSSQTVKEPTNGNEEEEKNDKEEVKREEKSRHVSEIKKKKNGKEKVAAETTKIRSKFSLALTRDEIDKDIMAMMKSSSTASIRAGMRNKAHKRCKTFPKYLDKIVPGFGTLHGPR